ncbi:hypothetical protein M422DRAFT_173794, partial [Sphaerobolus stellatus SS14]
SMTSWGTGHIELLACGTNSAIYQKRFLNGSWSPSWTSLGGTFVYEPVAVCMKPDWINIFAVGTDGKIYVKWSDGVTWGPSAQTWEDINAPEPVMARPTSISTEQNTLSFFVLDKSRVLWMKSLNGSSWSGFISLGGGRSLCTPAVVSTGPQKFDIFTV